MKIIKSFLAIIMVLVIAGCLTGCVSKKAANEEFAKWFSDVTIESSETGSGVTVNVTATDYFIEHYDFIAPKLVVDDTDYELTGSRTRRQTSLTGNRDTVSLIYILDFGDVSATDYDSLVILISYDDGVPITVTYYPDV